MNQSLRLAVLAGAAFVLAGCHLGSGLPVYGRVPKFDLVRESGQPFDQTDVAGRVWVANFFFTSCHGPCPRMSAQMKQLQKTFEDADDVALVSFTIDPNTDTPEVLRKYGERFGAIPGRWFFVTGEPRELRKLSKDTFFLNDIGPPFEHSTRFVLIDKQERIRGFYDSSDPDAIKDLVGHIRELQDEKM